MMLVAGQNLKRFLHPGCPPTLLIQGIQDRSVPVNAICAFYTKLVESIVPAINVFIPWTDHTFDLLLPKTSPTAHLALYVVDRFLALIVNKIEDPISEEGVSF